MGALGALERERVSKVRERVQKNEEEDAELSG